MFDILDWRRCQVGERRVSAQQQSTAERMLAARRALMRAEAATGLRTRLADDGAGRGALTSVGAVVGFGSATGAGADGATGGGAGADRGRAGAGAGFEVAASAGGPIGAPVDDDATGVVVGGGNPDYLPVPAALVPLLPATGLRRGSVVQVAGATSLLLALTAAAARDGGWAALAALPDIGLVAAAEAGLELGRTVLVPRPGPEAAATLGALVDGFDVIVVGPTRALGDRDRRLLSARLRTRGAVLLSAGPWPGTDAVLRAGQIRSTGLGDGWGTVQAQEMTVHGRSRWGAGGRLQVRVHATGLSRVGPVPHEHSQQAYGLDEQPHRPGKYADGPGEHAHGLGEHADGPVEQPVASGAGASRLQAVS